MATHTPGPWQVMPADRAFNPWTIGDAEGGSIADCEPAGPWMSDARADANARLIAAAPDLLAACKAQHDAIDRLFALLIIATRSDRPSESGMAFMPSKSGQPWDALVAGNAAIAKATGEAG